MTLDMPTGRKLADSPAMFEEFVARRDEIDQMRQTAPTPNGGGVLMASHEAPPAP